MPRVARIRRDEADSTVQVFAVVPASEVFDPGLSIRLGGKTLGRPFPPCVREVVRCSIFL